MAGEQKRLGKEARLALAAGDNRIVISAVVVWEVAIKRRLGNLEAPDDLTEQLERAAVDLLPITARHTDRAGVLPLHHRDPFDRLLIAQAALDDLTLVTADEAFERYDVEILW